MNVLALSAREFRLGTALAAGAWPVSFPPGRADTFDPALLQGRDLIYACLHGLPNQPYLYGDKFETALSAEQIRAVNLGGAVVYMAGCFGDGPVADAFLDAGASCIVGDRDLTWAGTWLPLGSNRLGRLFVRRLRAGDSPNDAYVRARQVFDASSRDPRDQAILDTVALRWRAAAPEAA